MNITHIKTDSYQLNIATTSKFKTIKITIVFSRDIRPEDVTARALIPYLLHAVSEKYPTRQSIQVQLEELYGASFSSSVRKSGLTQEIVFDFTIIHNDFVMEELDILSEGLSFLSEILFHPRFDEKIFTEEKRLLEEYFLGIYANKMRYSFQQLKDAMFAGQLYQLDALGIPSEFQDLSLQDVEKAYQNMMQNDYVSINVVGDVDHHEMAKRIDQRFPFTPRNTSIFPLDYTQPNTQDVRHIEVKQDVKQAKMVWGYQFPHYYLSEDYYVAVLFNMIFGGHSESLLFKRIREELNKVYFIGSSYDQYKGVLFLYAGINESDYNEVSSEIHHMITRLQSGDFEEKHLQIAKTSIVSNLYQSLDSSGSIAGRIHHLAIFDKTFDAQDLVDHIEDVTKADIIRLANTLTLDTTFILRGEDHE